MPNPARIELIDASVPIMTKQQSPSRNLLSEISQNIPYLQEITKIPPVTRPGTLCAPTAIHGEHGQENIDRRQ
jgi:hypothetical protein